MRNLLDAEHKLMLAAGGMAAVHRLTGRLQQVALVGPADYVGEDCLLTGGQLLFEVSLRCPRWCCRPAAETARLPAVLHSFTGVVTLLSWKLHMGQHVCRELHLTACMPLPI